jgi:hypothetical protein
MSQEEPDSGERERELDAATLSFLAADRLPSRADVLARPCPVPTEPGVYGWWFRSLPASIDVTACETKDGLTLLYVGISPKKPPTNGALPSRQTLRTRLRKHYDGNASGSTLRKTLGCLLADELGLELRPTGPKGRLTFGAGEDELSAWMGANAFVSWVIHPRRWEIEDHLIATLDLPLNLQGNARNRFHPVLTKTRRSSRTGEGSPVASASADNVCAVESDARFVASLLRLAMLSEHSLER